VPDRHWPSKRRLKSAEGAIVAFRTVGVGIPRHLVVVADTYRRAGRLNEGLTVLEELERRIETTHDRADEALLHLIRGDVLICLGDLRAAQVSFQKPSPSHSDRAPSCSSCAPLVASRVCGVTMAS
jgi:hypothetical protein